MVENDVVLFAPAKRADVVHVLVVKESFSNGFGNGISGPIYELGRQEKAERREF